MSGPGHEMVLRRCYAQATLDRWLGVPFQWGSADCIALVCAHLELCGFERPELPVYRSAGGAAKALKRMGHATLAEALDAHGLERIAPAFVRTGDIVSLDADHRLGCLAVYLGNDAMISWHESMPHAVRMRRIEAQAAWRVPHG